MRRNGEALHHKRRDDREAGDREAYLELWDGTGAGTATDRIGRGTIRINSPIASVFGSMQPGKLKALVANAVDGGVGDDGFPQRLQMAIWPDKLGAHKPCDRRPDYKAEARAFDIFKAFRDLDPMGAGAAHDFGEDISFMRFSPSAQDCFDKWLNALERRLRSDELIDYPAFESHLGKYRSLMPSLALISHLADVAGGAAPGPVSLNAARMAIEWCAFLEAHARKVYAAELSRGVNAIHLLATKIRDGAILDGTRVRNVHRSQWSGLKSSESVWLGLRELEGLGWVQIWTVRTTGGAPSHAIRLHPGLLRGAE